MPSYLPILSYSSSAEGENIVKLTSGVEKALSNDIENDTASTKSVEDKQVTSSPSIKSVDGEGKSQPANRRGGKKAVKKKKRTGGASKVAPVRDGYTKVDGATSNEVDKEKQEEFMMRAKSHAQAVHAVKRAVFEIQLFLLDGVRNKAQLESSSALLTQSEYQDVVVERSIDKQCGYPLCDKPLVPESKRKGRFRISVERDSLIQQDKLAAIVRSVRDLKASVNSKIEKPETGQPSDRFKDSLLSDVKERQEVGLNVASFEDSGPSDAVEGYTPVTSIRDWRLRRNVQEQASVSAASVSDNSEMAVPDSGIMINSAKDGKLSPAKSSPSVESFPGKGKATATLDTGKLTGSLQDAPILKSILKKCQSESPVKRSVSWGDQKVNGDQNYKVEPKVRQKTGHKARRQVKAMPEPPQSPRRTTAASSSASVGRAVLASNGAHHAGNVESNCDLAELQIMERLSLAEQPLSSTQQTVAAEDKSNRAEPVRADVQKVQEFPALEDITVPTVAVSSSSGQISSSEIKNDSTKPVTDAEAQLAERLASAKDLAAALMEAAEATAAGDFESSEAVARAGLSILSLDETRQELVPANQRSEAASEAEETARVDLIWPAVEPQEEDNDEVSSSKSGWHDTAPKNFKLEVSMFGTIWMALEEWVSAATVAFIYGKEADDEQDFLCVNGREYRLQVICEDGLSTEISRAFSGSIARVLPDVVQALRLRIPVSTIEQALSRMVRTMSFVEPLPAFGVNHWRMLAMLFLEGLSVDQLDSIAVQLSENPSLFRRLVIATGTSETEYDIFKGLLLPSGRLPLVSTLSGG